MTVITSVTLGTVDIKCERVSKPKPPNIVTHSIPERDGDIIQHMGHSSKRIRLINVKLFGANKNTDKATLEGYRDGDVPVSYNDTEEGTINVIVENVLFDNVGSLQNSFFQGNITLIRYNQT